MDKPPFIHSHWTSLAPPPPTHAINKTLEVRNLRSSWPKAIIIYSVYFHLYWRGGWGSGWTFKGWQFPTGASHTTSTLKESLESSWQQNCSKIIFKKCVKFFFKNWKGSSVKLRVKIFPCTVWLKTPAFPHIWGKFSSSVTSVSIFPIFPY